MPDAPPDVAHESTHQAPAVPPTLPSPDTASTMTGPLSAEIAYRQLGWPVILRGDDVSLNLDLDVDAVALALPAVLDTAALGSSDMPLHCYPTEPSNVATPLPKTWTISK